MKKNTPLFKHVMTPLSGLGLIVLLMVPLYAWELHNLITRPMLQDIPAMADSVQVSSLDDFLQAVEKDLPEFFDAEERWLQANLSYYPPLPENLVFQERGQPDDLQQRFIRALRINPETHFPLALQELPGSVTQPKCSAAEVSFIADSSWLESVHYTKIQPGHMARVMDVLATASDEPDMGMDVQLFEDNNKKWGKEYGFGLQPFADPRHIYSTQAAFHMGLWYEAPAITKAAPYLTHTLPEYRIHMFRELAAFAFAHHQDYWGWRFAGWGLHYIEDLGQPYHSRIMPGVSVAKMFWLNLLNAVGITGPMDRKISIIANRHIVLEIYLRRVMEERYTNALSAEEFFGDAKKYKELLWTDAIPREMIARHAAEKADETDALLSKVLPAQWVNDPSFDISGTDYNKKMLSYLRGKETASAEVLLNRQLAVLLSELSPAVRAYVRCVTPGDFNN